MKTQKSVAEIEMEELLKEAEDIVDDSYLKTQEARRILDAAYKIKEKCRELRESRDNWRARAEKAEKSSASINKANNSDRDITQEEVNKALNKVASEYVQKTSNHGGTK